MYTVIERAITGPQPQRQYPTFDAALIEAVHFTQSPGSWSAYIINADSVILADLKGKSAVPACRALACPP